MCRSSQTISPPYLAPGHVAPFRRKRLPVTGQPSLDRVLVRCLATVNEPHGLCLEVCDGVGPLPRRSPERLLRSGHPGQVRRCGRAAAAPGGASPPAGVPGSLEHGVHGVVLVHLPELVPAPPELFDPLLLHPAAARPFHDLLQVEPGGLQRGEHSEPVFVVRRRRQVVQRLPELCFCVHLLIHLRLLSVNYRLPIFRPNCMGGRLALGGPHSPCTFGENR